MPTSRLCDNNVIYFVYGISPTSDQQIWLAELCTARRIIHQPSSMGVGYFVHRHLVYTLGVEIQPVTSLLVVATDVITVVVDK